MTCERARPPWRAAGAHPGERARRAGRAARTMAALACAALVAGACGDDGAAGGAAGVDGASTAPVVAAGPPYDVTEVERTYVDPSRAVDDPAGNETAPERRLVTTVLVPDGDGPFPLVVAAHGLGGHPRKSTELFGAWAAAGYVVAAPAFPLTNHDVEPRHIADLTQLPGDVSAVIDGVVADAAEPEGPLAGRVDEAHVAVVGHSLGGSALYGVLANSCCRDARVTAGIGFAALKPDFEGEYATATDVPLLLVHGDADPVLPADGSASGYEEWPGPAWLLLFTGGGHSDAYEDLPGPHDDLVIDATLRFLDTHLRGVDRWSDYAPDPALATLEPTP